MSKRKYMVQLSLQTIEKNRAKSDDNNNDLVQLSLQTTEKNQAKSDDNNNDLVQLSLQTTEKNQANSDDNNNDLVQLSLQTTEKNQAKSDDNNNDLVQLSLQTIEKNHAKNDDNNNDLVQLSLQTTEKNQAKSDDNNNDLVSTKSPSETEKYDLVKIQGEKISQSYRECRNRELDILCHESDLSDNEENGRKERCNKHPCLEFDYDNEGDCSSIDDEMNDPDWAEYEFRDGKRKKKVASSESDNSSDNTIRKVAKQRKKKKKNTVDRVIGSSDANSINILSPDPVLINTISVIQDKAETDNHNTVEHGHQLVKEAFTEPSFVNEEYQDKEANVTENPIIDNEADIQFLEAQSVPEQIMLEEEVFTEPAVDINKTKAKSGKGDPDSWIKNVQKIKRMQGQQYKGIANSNEGKKAFIVERKERMLCKRNCSKRCEKSKMCFQLPEYQRQKIFDNFWNNMNWDEKRMYVRGLVDICVPQSLAEGSRKTQTFKYNLKIEGQQFIVCKELFLSSLGIGERMMYGWLSEKGDGSNNNQANKKYISEGMIKAKSFLKDLPKMPYHYCRSSSSKEYLEPIFESMQNLFRVYKQHCIESHTVNVCIQSFKRAFDDLNLALFRPRKDQCDICCGYNTGNITEDVYSEHIKRKDEAREEKVKDKTKALENNNVKVITVDMQSTLLSPKLKASSIYYKMKLACHNYTVYNLATRDCTCYFWHEGEFGLTADAFASCPVDHVKSLVEPGLNEIVIFSDGCCYQNRNVILANALLSTSVEFNVTITQKYLEKGHTQMEVDSVHSTIERKIRRKDIHVPVNYVELIKIARLEKPYEVNYLTYSFFKNYSSLRNYSSIRPGLNAGDPVVTDIRALQYKSSGVITYKLHFSDEYLEVPKRAMRLASNEQVELEVYSRPAKIKTTKYRHLQQLKSVLPKDYHSLYDNLLHDGEN